MNGGPSAGARGSSEDRGPAGLASQLSGLRRTSVCGPQSHTLVCVPTKSHTNVCVPQSHTLMSVSCTKSHAKALAGWSTGVMLSWVGALQREPGTF